MKQPILDALVAARRDKRAVVLATRLSDGAQSLIEGDTVTGELEVTEAIREAAGAARSADKGRTVEVAGAQVFVQPFNPPLRLIVVGAVHIAQPLVPIARIAGYEVTVVDPRRTFATDERFPDVALSDDWPDEALEQLKPDHRTAVVTLTHDPKLDDPALDVALKSEAFYIAALGSKKTHASRIERLVEAGHDRAALDRIHGPAGLSIGAVSPAEIAVAIMAQMTAVLRGSAT
ncbi:MAG: XdhC family protein [Azospirillaceae bacterium]